MATVVFDHATRVYPGAQEAAVKELDLDIADGEFLVLVGPSGCGKSTSLRMLAGLEEVNEGRVLIGERDVTGMAPKDRDIAMVFQNYALYPHMSVADNMGFALKISGVGKEERRQRVVEAARLLDLEELLDRKPKALSGGQRQRVAMGRAIVRNPQVFLMDEPLSNLDAKLRVQTRTEIRRLHEQVGTTTIYVTHDQVEAMTMGDRVAVMSEGALEQVGDTRAVYEQPSNVFVAGFIGSPSMSFATLDVTSIDDAIVLSRGGVSLTIGDARGLADRIPGEVIVGLRPEHAHLWVDGNSLVGPVVGRAEYVEMLGREMLIGVATGSNQQFSVLASPDAGVKPGEQVEFGFERGRLYLFDSATQLALGII